MVGISQIVLADQATAEAVIKALKSGHAFADLAKTKSTETTSGKNSGYVGSSLLSQLDSKIRDALKDLKVGAFTETPISHMGQWYVFRLDKKEKATLKEARPALESLAMARASQALLLEEKEKAKVRFYTLEGKETTEVTPIFTAPKSDKEASAPVAPAAAG